MNVTPATAETPDPPPMRPLTRRQEAYARCVATGMSYAEAFRSAGLLASSAGSQAHQIGALNRTPIVRARIAELRAKFDEHLVSSQLERMTMLRNIVAADPDELSKIVSEPCGNCWTDEAVAKAYAAHFSVVEEFDDRPPLPDQSKPRRDCTHCSGAGISRVVLTPTDELSPEARALFRGAKQNDKGVIEILTHDKMVAADMLNRMQGVYISKSLNLNINANVQAARDVPPEDAARLFEAFGE